jgi:hypothetical protein
MVVAVLVLRLLIHGTGGAPAPATGQDEDDAYREPGEPERRNAIQRWFNRDDNPG